MFGFFFLVTLADFAFKGFPPTFLCLYLTTIGASFAFFLANVTKAFKSAGADMLLKLFRVPFVY